MRSFQFHCTHTAQPQDKYDRTNGPRVHIIQGINFEQALLVFRHRCPEDIIEYVESGEPF